MVREASVEFWVGALAEELGGKAFKLEGYTGIPDRLVLLPGGIIFFVETKTVGGRLSPAQRIRHKFLRALGFDVFVPYTRQSVEKIFDRFKQKPSRPKQRKGHRKSSA